MGSLVCVLENESVKSDVGSRTGDLDTGERGDGARRASIHARVFPFSVLVYDQRMIVNTVICFLTVLHWCSGRS